MNTQEFNQLLQQTQSAYPTLTNTNITLSFEPANRCFAAQPIIKTLFTKQRTYKIIISIKEPFTTHIQNLSQQAKKGWIAHELAHIIDYETKSLRQLIKFAALYGLSKKARKHIEFYTNQIAMDHGFIQEIIEAHTQNANSKFLSEAFKTYFKEIYLPLPQTQTK